MLHQPGHPPPQCRARILGHNIPKRFPKIHRPLLGRTFLRQIIPEPNHLGPIISVKVVYGAAGADDEGVCLTERAQGCAEFDVEVWVETRVVGDDDVGEGFAAWEHPFEDHAVKGLAWADAGSEARAQGGDVQCIVDLFKLGLERRIESGIGQ